MNERIEGDDDQPSHNKVERSREPTGRLNPKERLEVFAGGRIAVLDDFRRVELFQNGKRSVVNSPLRQDKGHRAEWEAFNAAVTSGGPPPIPYHHLFGVARATFAAVEALRSAEKVRISPGE